MMTDVETLRSLRILARAATEAPFSPPSIKGFLDLLAFIDGRADNALAQDGPLPRAWHGVVGSVIGASTRPSGHGLPARTLRQWAEQLRGSVGSEDVPALMEYARACRAWSHDFRAVEPLDKGFSLKPLLTSLKQGEGVTRPIATERRAQGFVTEPRDRRTPAVRSAALVERRRRAFMLGQSDLNELEAILTAPRHRVTVAPLCPLCGEALAMRRAQWEINAGRGFVRCVASGCVYTRTA